MSTAATGRPSSSGDPADIGLDEVSVAIDGVRIVARATLEASAGQFIGLVGPNGSGKSTLLRSVYRSLRPHHGVVRVGGDDVWAIPSKEAARRTAVLAQDTMSEFDFLVREVVEMGRSPHKRLFERDAPIDFAIVEQAMRRTGVVEFQDRVFSTLSGGERQRVLLARCLAQQPRLLVLDEPTNHLDVRAQFELLDLVREVGMTTLSALHDLNIAARYCDRIFVLCAGTVISHGEPPEVLTPELLAEVFGVRARCDRDPTTGQLHVILLGAIGRVDHSVHR